MLTKEERLKRLNNYKKSLDSQILNLIDTKEDAILLASLYITSGKNILNLIYGPESTKNIVDKLNFDIKR